MGMTFLKRRSDYQKVYSKNEAIKRLREEEKIIEKITSSLGKMIIHTIPIIPKGFEGDMIFLYPVGTYKIVLTEKTRVISVNITRKEGKVRKKLDDTEYNKTWHHAHIRTSWEKPICWGNIDEEVEVIRQKKDWYWLVKRCLDLILDWKMEDGYKPTEEWVDTKMVFQLDYMKEDPRVLNKLIKQKNEMRRGGVFIRRYDWETEF